jgi:hypothetical protein
MATGPVQALVKPKFVLPLREFTEPPSRTIRCLVVKIADANGRNMSPVGPKRRFAARRNLVAIGSKAVAGRSVMIARFDSRLRNKLVKNVRVRMRVCGELPF